MLVTLAGMVKLVRLLQLLKTPDPRLITPWGIATLGRLEQLANA